MSKKQVKTMSRKLRRQGRSKTYVKPDGKVGINIDPNPTKEMIQQVLDEVDSYDLPDGAHWMMCHQKLNLEYGDLFPLMEKYGMLGEEKTDG